MVMVMLLLFGLKNMFVCLLQLTFKITNVGVWFNVQVCQKVIK